MKASSVAVAVALCVLLATAPDADAWEPETRLKMVDEAVRLMPTSLRMALERYRKAVRRGALEPLVDEGSPEHLPPWQGGSLDERIAISAASLVDGVEQAVPFREVARRFGQLAHYVADAGFPPGISDADGTRRYRHFAKFCESRRDRFRLVFHGHGELAVGPDGLRGFARDVLARARREDLELARAYAAAGNPPDPAHFDDRSVPFAVGSLAYSHTVTDIVRAWLIAWKRAGGDMGRTPYLDPDRQQAGDATEAPED